MKTLFIAKCDSRISRYCNPLHAFTLLELLIVIAIIGVLAALLIPVVAKVQGSTDATKCMANMRELAKAVHMYANDNQGQLVYISRNNPFAMWYWDLSPYLGGEAGKNDASPLYRCPTYMKLAKNGSLPANYTNGILQWQYGIGLNFAPTYTNRGWSTNQNNPNSQGVRTNQLDYTIPNMPRPEDANKGLGLKDIPLFADSYEFQVRFPRATSPEANWHGGKRNSESNWQDGYFNVVYFDGHGEKLPASKMPQLFPN